MIDDPSPSEAGATGDIDGIDAAALMGQIESGQDVSSQASPNAQATPVAGTQGNAAQSGAQAQSSAQSTPATPAAPWEKDTIKINGQDFQATRAQILQWAAQGRNYPQLVQQLNAKEAELTAKYKTYAEIDQFAKANPEWWNTVTQSYQNKGAQNPATAQVPPEVQQRLDQLTQFQSSFEAEKANQALNADVTDIRKQYPDLSWDTLDESGNSLENRVLDHAIKNGIQSFKTAFRDLMHDHLIKYSADKAKETAVKELQAKRKTGLVGVSTTSQHQQVASAPKKFSSYDDAAAAAMHSLGINTA